MEMQSPSRPEPWQRLPAPEVADRLGTDLDRGLAPEEAARRLAFQGPNRLLERPARTSLRMFLDQFANLLVGLLAAATILAAVVGDFRDAAAILAIIVLNGVIGFVQERRAADALAALRKMAAPTARVRRGGATMLVPAAQLVPGDLVVLETGDHVPADLRLVRGSGLRILEAALTGESEAVDKDAASRIGEEAEIAERENMAFMATAVVGGTAEGLVVATGPATEFGRIAELVRTAPEEETPLQARLRVFGKWLVAGSGAVVALVFAMGLMRGIPLASMVLASISLAVAAVPEGLPAVVTIALALGVHRMARRNAVIRRLASVETLGCTTVICADKTGTLTTGRMTVVRIEGERERTLWAAVACSTARLNGEEVVGDPTEGALLLAAREAGFTLEQLEKREPLVSIQPFDSARKRMSVVRQRGSLRCSYVKGAPESVLPLCPNHPAHLRDLNEEMARRGLRVLAVAMKEGDREPESDLLFLGLVGMRDPPRPEAGPAVQACRDAGIRPIMITGDHPRTALSVAREIGIAADESEVLSGREIDAMEESQFDRLVPEISVYARVNPEHKLRIVQAWRRRGDVVAMTGDGVNDAPALRGADIGVAMGRGGTDVAKDASAMVIADDNFATIVSAVKEGRAVYENIRKTLLYLISGNGAEILVMAGAVLAGWPLPLLPIQLLWVNLVTDGLPALALATDPAHPDLLKRPPRRPGAEIADRRLVGILVVSSVLAAACTLAAFLYGLWVLGSVEQARTLAFSTIVIEEVLRAFSFRSLTHPVWEVGFFSNLPFLAVAVGTIGLQILGGHLPVLEDLLRTGALSAWQIAGIFALGAVPAGVLEISKLIRQKYGRES